MKKIIDRDFYPLLDETKGVLTNVQTDNISLGEFLENYTSEENAAFSTQQNKKRPSKEEVGSAVQRDPIWPNVV